jgi:hypothetical protein
MNTLEIQQDEHIRANYIPAPPRKSERDDSADYVKKYENARARRAAAAAAPAAPAQYEDLYIPILVAILYFIFQMPTITKLMFRYLKVFHSTDGNLSNIGLLLKSALFGGAFYTIMRTTNIFS